MEILSSRILSQLRVFIYWENAVKVTRGVAMLDKTQYRVTRSRSLSEPEDEGLDRTLNFSDLTKKGNKWCW